MNEVKKIAKKMGISAHRVNKKDLVRTIQQTEGFDTCYRTGVQACPEKSCSWREDCFE